MNSGDAAKLLIARGVLPSTPAAKMQLIQELRADYYEDEEGVRHPREPLITAEEARDLLGLPEPAQKLE